MFILEAVVEYLRRCTVECSALVRVRTSTHTSVLPSTTDVMQCHTGISRGTTISSPFRYWHGFGEKHTTQKKNHSPQEASALLSNDSVYSTVC